MQTGFLRTLCETLATRFLPPKHLGVPQHYKLCTLLYRFPAAGFHVSLASCCTSLVICQRPAKVYTDFNNLVICSSRFQRQPMRILLFHFYQAQISPWSHCVFATYAHFRHWTTRPHTRYLDLVVIYTNRALLCKTSSPLLWTERIKRFQHDVKLNA